MQLELHLDAARRLDASARPLTKPERFAGAEKASASLLSPLERRLGRAVLPRIPACLETYHLTCLTLLWSALVLVFSWLAASDTRMLWGVSLMIFLQWATDHFDGKVGKLRGTGLVRWGFYMDHLLDYVFLCSILVGYALFLPERATLHVLCLLAVFGGFMVNSFLDLSARGKFRISYLKFGPTEFRLALVVLNALVVYAGTRRVVKVLPFVAAGALAFLCVLVYRTQKKIWRLDMEAKRRAEAAAAEG